MMLDSTHLFSPLLAAARLSPQAQMMIGALGALGISFLTFSNWRLGVKIAFVMVLVEGAIRKWAFPQGQELAYFLKDIFLIGSYLRFFFFPDANIRAWRVRAPTGLIAFLCVIVSFSALNPNIGSPILSAYGIKIYMFYLPLAFMIPHLFKSQEDLANNLFWYAMCATPICLLGIAQFAAPGYSFLNVYAAPEAELSSFGFGEKVRITGSFSYLTGYATFIIFFTGLHMALLMNKMARWRWLALMANLPLLAANGFMSGSRGAMIASGFIVAGFVIFSLVQKVGTGGNIILVAGSAAIMVMMVVSSFFTEAKDHWMARYKVSGDSVSYRVVEMPLGSLMAAIREGGVFGYGIGMTHPASEKLRRVLEIKPPKQKPPVYDSEIGQVLIELGIMGFVGWYILRFLVLAGSFASFLNCPAGILKSMLLAGVLIQAPHMVMSVVLNHTANFLLFGCYGLALIPRLQPAIERGRRNAAPSASPPQLPTESNPPAGRRPVGARRL